MGRGEGSGGRLTPPPQPLVPQQEEAFTGDVNFGREGREMKEEAQADFGQVSCAGLGKAFEARLAAGRHGELDEGKVHRHDLHVVARAEEMKGGKKSTHARM